MYVEGKVYTMENLDVMWIDRINVTLSLASTLAS